VDAHSWLALVSLAAALAGVALVALGVIDRRRTAAQIEAEAPDGSAAASARHEAFNISIESGPPPSERSAALRQAHDPEARRAFEIAKPARAEAAKRVAEAIDRSDSRERALRRSLASDLRGGMWREALGAALVIAGAVASFLLDVAQPATPWHRDGMPFRPTEYCQFLA
jgi:hypothetical protein